MRLRRRVGPGLWDDCSTATAAFLQKAAQYHESEGGKQYVEQQLACGKIVSYGRGSNDVICDYDVPKAQPYKTPTQSSPDTYFPWPGVRK
jgi:hypothetical protein